MVDGPIISRAMIRESARAAFFARRSRDQHNMNPSAAAIPVWQAEHDRLTTIAAALGNDAPTAGECVDLAQEGA